MANCAVKGWPATTVRRMSWDVRAEASVICWYDADTGVPSAIVLPGATITRLNGTPFADLRLTMTVKPVASADKPPRGADAGPIGIATSPGLRIGRQSMQPPALGGDTGGGEPWTGRWSTTSFCAGTCSIDSTVGALGGGGAGRPACDTFTSCPPPRNEIRAEALRTVTSPFAGTAKRAEPGPDADALELRLTNPVADADQAQPAPVLTPTSNVPASDDKGTTVGDTR